MDYGVRELRLNEFHVLMAAFLLLQYIEQTNNFTSTYPLGARIYTWKCASSFQRVQKNHCLRKAFRYRTREKPMLSCISNNDIDAIHINIFYQFLYIVSFIKLLLYVIIFCYMLLFCLSYQVTDFYQVFNCLS